MFMLKTVLKVIVVIALLFAPAHTCTAQDSTVPDLVIEGVPKILPSPPGGTDLMAIESHLQHLKELEDRLRAAVGQFNKDMFSARKAAYRRYADAAEASAATDTDTYLLAKGFAVISTIESTDDPDTAAGALDDLTELFRTRDLASAQAHQAMMAAEAFTGNDPAVKRRAVMRLADVLLRSDDPNARRAGELLEGTVRRKELQGAVLELSGTTLDGEAFDIASLRGKYVLVDFWATWCGPCVEEQKNIAKHLERYGKHGLEVVGVSLDDSLEVARNFVKGNDSVVNWPVLHGGLEEHPAIKRYGIVQIPVVMLLDREGKVISSDAHGKELEALLNEVFDASFK